MSHYSGGYAIAIVQEGNVVETRQDSRVAIPFGSDYAIRLINRNGKRAVAVVYVDGQNVSGGGLIVNAHGSLDLERPTDKAVTFRFASTESEAAEAHGKAGPDVDGSKGLIEVKWRPEKQYLPYYTGYLGAMSEKGLSGDCLPPAARSYNASSLGGVTGQSLNFCDQTEVKTASGIELPDSTLTKRGVQRKLQSGVTVEGAHSTQRFQTIHFDVDYSVAEVVTSIKLMGYVAQEGVPREGTLHCPQCKTRTKKQTDIYCRRCGEKF